MGTTLEIIIASSLTHHNLVKIEQNNFFQKRKIITEKFSFDHDQAELCSFIRSKVRGKRKVMSKAILQKKYGLVINWHCDM